MSYGYGSYQTPNPAYSQEWTGSNPQSCNMSHLGKRLSEIEMEPIDFEMSLDIEEQAALWAQKKRDEERLEKARERLYENNEGPERSCQRQNGYEEPFGSAVLAGTASYDDISSVCTEDHYETIGRKQGETGLFGLYTDEDDTEEEKAGEVDEEYGAYYHLITPKEPRPTFVHTENRILTLRSPYLGPVGWTVPRRDGLQLTKPFLIYQDPSVMSTKTAAYLGYSAPPPTPRADPRRPAFATWPVNEHINLLASDDKENVPGDIDEEDEDEDMPDRDAHVQDNIVAEAENIVELAASRERRDFFVGDQMLPRSFEYGYQENAYAGGEYRYENEHENGHEEYDQFDPQLEQQRMRERERQREQREAEMEFNIAMGDSLDASPVRSQRAHSNSIVAVISPPRRVLGVGVDDAGDPVGRGWDGSPGAPLGFF
ncbi:hypothetical protein FQN51_006051 [Onygenales sp. PD_10]|nr:hypothetical protein FQN51_006051 [Onygenales sp. PD_10]